MTAAYERNLIIVHSPGLQARSDFEGVASRLADRAPDIEVFIVANRARNSVSRRQASHRPTLVFSPVALREFRPVRGKIYAGQPHTKMEEVARFASAGIPVPETVPITPETRLDPQTWGAFTVVKPNVGRGGNGVLLQRTRDVHWVDPSSWPKDDPRFEVDLFAQRFIDSGTFTTCFRVTTTFGRPLWSTRSRQLRPRPFVLDPLGTAPIEVPIAANHGERTVTLNMERDILDFGARVAGAFPEIPTLGVDVIREEVTGDLYALEVNASGFTWHLSSDYFALAKEKYGLDLHGQFGALDVLAEALIDVTRREAI